MLVLMFVTGEQTVWNYKIILIKWKTAFHQVQKSKNNDKIKVLGIVWDTVNDYLIYSFEDLVESLKSVIPSKRNNLSLIAKFYDPVGLIQPVITKLKLLGKK